jgi:hypothetical protein
MENKCWNSYLLSILWNKDMSGPSITYFHIVSSLFNFSLFFSTFCEEDAITTLSYKTFFSFWVAFQILFPKLLSNIHFSFLCQHPNNISFWGLFIIHKCLQRNVATYSSNSEFHHFLIYPIIL